MILKPCFHLHNKGFQKYYKNIYILLISNIYYFGGLFCSPLLYFYITQQQLNKMDRAKRPVRDWVRNAPQFPTEVVSAIPEVGATNRLGVQHLVLQIHV